MTNLILSSNFNDNKLLGVGGATLRGEIITIVAEIGTNATLLRGVNKVVLLQANEQQQTASGKVVLDDVYTLENGERKLIIKVENEEVDHDTNLYDKNPAYGANPAYDGNSAQDNNSTFDNNPVYIDNSPVFDATSKKRKTTLTVGTLILVLLIASVIFGLKQKNLKEFNTRSEQELQVAITSYETQTRESFVTAKEIAERLKNDGYENERLNELLKNIYEKESEILGELKPEVKELLDLTLQINGFNGEVLSSTGETMFAFDKLEKNVVQVDVNGKNAKIVASKDDVGDTKQIASYEDELFLDKEDGVYEVGDNSLFYMYAGNIYIVNKEENTIQRYSGANGSFGEAKDWLAPGIEADFSKVTDMTIDGSIWLLSSTGKVTKFTNGNPQSVSMEGMIEPLSNPTAIYTNELNKNVYILDKEKGRVVVIDKTGEFKLQYISEEIKNAKDLVVSEEEGKIILLTGPKLMYIAL